MAKKKQSEKLIRDIKRQTRRKFNSEEKIRIVLEGLRGEETVVALCRKEGISPALYYKWSKDFMRAERSSLFLIVLIFGSRFLLNQRSE